MFGRGRFRREKSSTSGEDAGASGAWANTGHAEMGYGASIEAVIDDDIRVPVIETADSTADQMADALKSDIAELDEKIRRLQSTRTALMRELGRIWTR